MQERGKKIQKRGRMAREAREEDGYEMRVPYVAKRVLKRVRGAQVPSCSELGRKGLWIEG